jgi:hypothetical protein
MTLLGVLLHEVVQKNLLYSVLLSNLHDNDKYFYNNITYIPLQGLLCKS